MIPREQSWRSLSEEPNSRDGKDDLRVINSDNFQNYPGFFAPQQSEHDKKQQHIAEQLFQNLSKPKRTTRCKKESKPQQDFCDQHKKLLYFYSCLDDILQEVQNDPRVELLLYQEIDKYFEQPQPDRKNFFQYAGDKVRRIIRKYKDPENQKRNYSSQQSMKKSVRIDCLTEIYLFFITNKPKDILLTTDRFRQFLYSALRIEGLGEQSKFIPKDLDINLKRRGYDILNILSGSGAIQKLKNQQQGKQSQEQDYEVQNDYAISKQYSDFYGEKQNQRELDEVIDLTIIKAQQKCKQLENNLKNIQELVKIAKRNKRLHEKGEDKELVKVDLDSSSYYWLSPQKIEQLQKFNYTEMNQWLQNKKPNSLYPKISKALNQPKKKHRGQSRKKYKEQSKKRSRSERSHMKSSVKNDEIYISDERSKKQEEQRHNLSKKYFDLQQYDHDLQLVIEQKSEKLKQLQVYVDQQQREIMEFHKDSKKNTLGKKEKKKSGKGCGRKKKKKLDDSDQEFHQKKKTTKKAKIFKEKKPVKPKMRHKRQDENKKSIILPPIQEEDPENEQINPMKKWLGTCQQMVPKYQPMEIEQPIQQGGILSEEEDSENILI